MENLIPASMVELCDKIYDQHIRDDDNSYKELEFDCDNIFLETRSVCEDLYTRWNEGSLQSPPKFSIHFCRAEYSKLRGPDGK